MPRKIPEQHWSHLQCGGNLKSRTIMGAGISRIPQGLSSVILTILRDV